MTKVEYQFPEIDSSRLVYKGQRFWIIELSNEKESQLSGWSNKDGDCVFYDAKSKLFFGEGIYAIINKRKDGKFDVEPITHFDVSYVADSIKEVVRTLPKVIDDYYKKILGE